MDTSETLSIVLGVLAPFAPPGAPITADTELLELGMIDSAAMVNILLELEQRLNVRLQAADLTFDHFQTPRMLAERFSQCGHD